MDSHFSKNSHFETQLTAYCLLHLISFWYDHGLFAAVSCLFVLCLVAVSTVSDHGGYSSSSDKEDEPFGDENSHPKRNKHSNNDNDSSPFSFLPSNTTKKQWQVSEEFDFGFGQEEPPPLHVTNQQLQQQHHQQVLHHNQNRTNIQHRHCGKDPSALKNCQKHKKKKNSRKQHHQMDEEVPERSEKEQFIFANRQHSWSNPNSTMANTHNSKKQKDDDWSSVGTIDSNIAKFDGPPEPKKWASTEKEPANPPKEAAKPPQKLLMFKDKLLMFEDKPYHKPATLKKAQSMLYKAVLLLTHKDEEIRKLKEEKRANTGLKMPINKEVKHAIKAKYNTYCWPFTKFVQDEEDVDDLLDDIYHLIHQDADAKKLTKEYEACWKNTYHQLVREEPAYHRGYVQNQLKSAIFKYHKKNGKLPDLELIRKCALHQIDLDNAEEYKVFMWYWTTLASKLFAFAHFQWHLCPFFHPWEDGQGGLPCSLHSAFPQPTCMKASIWSLNSNSPPKYEGQYLLMVMEL